MPVSLKSIAFTAAALLLVVVLWHIFSAPGPAVSNAAPGKEVFDLVLKDGKLASGPSVMQVHEGEQIVLRISSNTTDELHLHGYDLQARITPQQMVVLEFSANRTGRFTLELHEAQTELSALEVYPR